jgi:hypothetical protein
MVLTTTPELEAPAKPLPTALLLAGEALLMTAETNKLGGAALGTAAGITTGGITTGWTVAGVDGVEGFAGVAGVDGTTGAGVMVPMLPLAEVGSM